MDPQLWRGGGKEISQAGEESITLTWKMKGIGRVRGKEKKIRTKKKAT